eukprot:TRINITY_DN997_c0_g1_i1.p1 TRINITY_DN997_c0_g1~~TRINITY_DN997_c0_g1_i1.p1  ORF type:complete len:233 (-),score=35.10 TRINITY_DN997_c0_g1_i1:30-728(-)
MMKEMYVKGLAGIEKNREKGNKMFSKCLDFVTKECEKGDLEICNQLGEFLLMTEEEDAGIELLQKSCDNQNAEGCYYMGLYLTGKDNEDTISSSAINHFQKACDLGSNPACTILAEAIYEGHSKQHGKLSELDRMKKVVPLLEKALPDTCSPLFEWLADSYFKGTKFVPKDINRAKEISARGCSCNMPEACFIHANILRSSPDYDKTEVKRYLRLACGMGHKSGCRELLLEL